MPINSNADRSDVINSSYVTGTVTVGTSAVEAKVGGSPLSGRQELIIYNSSSSDIYFGPSGVTTTTGVLLSPGDILDSPFGENISVYLISGVGGLSVVVQEMA